MSYISNLPFARDTVFYYCFFFGVVLLFLLQSFLLRPISIPPAPLPSDKFYI